MKKTYIESCSCSCWLHILYDRTHKGTSIVTEYAFGHFEYSIISIYLSVPLRTFSRWKKAIKHASQLKNDTFFIAWRLHDVHLQLDTFHVMYIYRY